MIKIFKPVFNKVTVRELKPEEQKSPGGVLLPAKDMNPAVIFGEVVGVGPGKDADNPMPVKEGDKIAYPQTDGRYITVNGEELKIIDASVIIGVVVE